MQLTASSSPHFPTFPLFPPSVLWQSLDKCLDSLKGNFVLGIENSAAKTKQKQTTESKFSSNYPACCGVRDSTARMKLTKTKNQNLPLCVPLINWLGQQRLYLLIIGSHFTEHTFKHIFPDLLTDLWDQTSWIYFPKSKCLFAVPGAESVSKQWGPWCSDDFLSRQAVAKNDHPSLKAPCRHLMQLRQPAQSFLGSISKIPD